MSVQEVARFGLSEQLETCPYLIRLGFRVEGDSSVKVLLESPTERVSASLLQQRTTWQGLGPNCRFGQVPRTLEAGVGFAENRKGLEVKGRELRVVGMGLSVAVDLCSAVMSGICKLSASAHSDNPAPKI